ncbi:MAG: hypothetical protein HDR01_13195 [Lachnospiraceae bacterium]|nr:hypothetical protein [Lachnospiraceae bacterium]
MNFIKAELFRFSRKKVFYIAFLGLVCLALFFCKTIEADDAGMVVKASLTYGTAVIPILFVPIYLQIWQADFASRFINNILVSGMSRVHYYFGKLLMMYLFGEVLALIYGFSVLIFSYCLKGEFLIGEYLKAIAVQNLLYLVVMAVGLMIYIVVDVAALSTAVYLLFILLFENLVSALLKQMHINIEKISSYMIMQNLTKAVSVVNLQKNEIYPMLISGIVLWIISVGISVFLLKEREYK